MSRIGRRTTLSTKRVADFLGALGALLLLGPVLLVVALAIRLTMGRPVLFRQIRAGHGGHPFTLVKFRTMRDLRDAAGELLPDAERLTGLGRFLRRTSLDELPELWNILRGEMSLVGPRPLYVEYLPHYSPEQARRHLMPQGLTGWTQCNFRGAGRTWKDKLAGDVWYVDHWSLWLDLRIVVATFGALVRRGQLADGTPTQHSFLDRSRSPERGDLTDGE